MNEPLDPPNSDRLPSVPAELRKAIEERLPEQVRRLPPDIKEQTIEVAASLSVEYSGSIPPWPVVAGWEKNHPGAADRFLKLVENEQEAMIRNVDDCRHRNDRFRILGLVIGGLLIAAQLGCAIFSLWLQYPYIAALFLGTGVTSVVVAFLRLTASPTPAEPPAPEKPKTRKTKR
ncbi:MULTISPECIES: hypothetical protein [Rhodoplanes]|uniref:hypothetical protein n=1 Tax=Rhodoplanes TaxID=29407 RepID=UPI00101C0AA6|nr:hypothetical protein [Rhodoplanes serenus]